MDIDEVKELKRNTEVAIFNLLCEIHNKTGMNISSLAFDTVKSFPSLTVKRLSIE